MATYYIDFVAGADGNTGAQGAAKKTLKGFDTVPTITLANSDVIILVNSGAHELPLSANEYSITKTVTIRGGTALGANAVATISSTSDTTARRYVEAAASGVITFENIIFDFTATTADADAYDVLRYNGATGKQQFRGCEFKGSALGGSNHAGLRRIFNQVSNPGAGVDTIHFYRCYFQNIATPAVLQGVQDNIFEECVIVNDITGQTFLSKTIAAGAGGELAFTQSTIYGDYGVNAAATMFSYNMGGTSGTLTAHSNIIWLNSSNAATLINFLRDSSGLGTPAGTRDYNILLGGPDVSGAGEILNNGWYERAWDPDQNDATGSDTYPHDVVAYGVAAAMIFNAPGSSYAWSTVNSQTITLPKDLRPRLYLTSSLSGGVPGALPSAQTDLSVSIATSNYAPNPSDPVTLTVTAANSGTNATSVVYAAAIPAGLTLVTATPSAGSYLAGVWTIGSLATGNSATLSLACTVDADQGGEAIICTASVTSGDPSSDPDSSNNTDSLTLNVIQPPSSDPGTIPYLDVAPIYAPVLKAEINASIYTKRNRIRHNQVRRDYDVDWREYTGRRITIAPSTTITLTSGIEQAAYLLLESTGDVQVSLSTGDTTNFFPATTRLAVLASAFSVLKIQNPSASVSVDVLMLVID